MNLKTTFAETFNRRDIEGLTDLLAGDATAQVIGSPFPVEEGAAKIATTSFPHILGDDALTAEVWEDLVLVSDGDGGLDMAIRIEGDEKITRIEYLVIPHQPAVMQEIAERRGVVLRTE